MAAYGNAEMLKAIETIQPFLARIIPARKIGTVPYSVMVVLAAVFGHAKSTGWIACE